MYFGSPKMNGTTHALLRVVTHRRGQNAYANMATPAHAGSVTFPACAGNVSLP